MASRLPQLVLGTLSRRGAASSCGGTWSSSASTAVAKSLVSSSMTSSVPAARFMASKSGSGDRGSARDRPPTTADSNFSLGLDDSSSEDEQARNSAAAAAKRAAIAQAKEKRQAEAKASAEAAAADAEFDSEDGIGSSSSELESEEEEDAQEVPVVVDTKAGTAVPAWLGIAGTVADASDSDNDAPVGGRRAFVDPSAMAVDDRLRVDPEYRARATKQSLYRRRNLRAAFDHDEDEMEQFAAAFAREHQFDIELSDLEDITRADDYRRGKGEDPLERLGGLPFNLNAVTFKSTMSLSHPLRQKKRNRRVRIEACVRDLGVDETTASYIRAIAGTHYHRAADRLVVASDRSEDQAINRREVIEQLTMLVLEAKRLKGVHGEFPTVVKLPRYSH